MSSYSVPRTPDDFLNSVDEMDTGGRPLLASGTRLLSPGLGAKVIGKKTSHDPINLALIGPALFLCGSLQLKCPSF